MVLRKLEGKDAFGVGEKQRNWYIQQEENESVLGGHKATSEDPRALRSSDRDRDVWTPL